MEYKEVDILHSLKSKLLMLRISHFVEIIVFLFVFFFCFDLRVLLAIICIPIISKIIQKLLEAENKEEDIWRVQDISLLIDSLVALYKLICFKIRKR